jgi:hypothetical protein
MLAWKRGLLMLFRNLGIVEPDNIGCNIFEVVFYGEMAAGQAMQLRTRKVTLKGLASGRRKEDVVLTPEY